MTKQTISGDERRAAIIEAAINVMARTSFEDCSTIAIAKEAGITEPLIYYHFKTKKDLQLTVLDNVLKEAYAILDILQTLPTLTISEMRVSGKQFQRDIKKNPGRITVVLKALAMEDAQIKEKIWEVLQTIHSALQMLLDKIASKSGVSIKEQTNKEAWSMLFWISMLSSINQLGKHDAIPEEQIDWMVLLLDEWFQKVIKDAKLKINA